MCFARKRWDFKPCSVHPIRAKKKIDIISGQVAGIEAKLKADWLKKMFSCNNANKLHASSTDIEGLGQIRLPPAIHTDRNLIG